MRDLRHDTRVVVAIVATLTVLLLAGVFCITTWRGVDSSVTTTPTPLATTVATSTATSTVTAAPTHAVPSTPNVGDQGTGGSGPPSK